MACVQREERQRINQFVFAEDAALSLVRVCECWCFLSPTPPLLSPSLVQAGRLLLRAAIVEELQISNSTLRLERTTAGKPCLVCDGHVIGEVAMTV